MGRGRDAGACGGGGGGGGGGAGSALRHGGGVGEASRRRRKGWVRRLRWEIEFALALRDDGLRGSEMGGQGD